jgi:transketolase
MFIRLAQGKADRVLYQPGSQQFTIGKSIVARDGGDVTLFSHGEMVFHSINARWNWRKKEIHARAWWICSPSSPSIRKRL